MLGQVSGNEFEYHYLFFYLLRNNVQCMREFDIELIDDAEGLEDEDQNQLQL